MRMNVYRAPLLTACIAFSSVQNLSSASQTATHAFHGFRVEVTLSEKAKKELTDRKETIIVAGYFTGTPQKNVPLKQYQKYLSRPGPLGLGESEVEVSPGETAIFQEIKLNRNALAQVDGDGPQLLINVVSGRKSSQNNLILCDDYEGSLKAVEGTTIPVSCRLIRE